jgi:hypothetical protein
LFLLNAYYGGAPTMFFTSEITIPFKRIKDVMKAYPDWTLIIQVGSESYFALNAKHDLNYADYWAISANNAR